MKMNKTYKEQELIIEEFDEKLFSYTGQIAWFLPGIFSFCSIALGAIPFSEFDKSDRELILIMCYLVCMITYFVLQPYLWCNGFGNKLNAKSDSIYKVLKHIPVSKRIFISSRMKYLFRYIWKLAAIVMVIRLIVDLVSKSFLIVNYLYVILCYFVIPMLVGYLLVRVHVELRD